MKLDKGNKKSGVKALRLIHCSFASQFGVIHFLFGTTLFMATSRVGDVRVL